MKERTGEKSEKLLSIEAELAELKQKRLDQIEQDRKKKRELERQLRTMIGEMVIRYLPEYERYEKSEMEEIIRAAMRSRECKKMIAEIHLRNGEDPEVSAEDIGGDEITAAESDEGNEGGDTDPSTPFLSGEVVAARRS